MIQFTRDILHDFNFATSREWLETDGIRAGNPFC
jgi:hypothetical protein